MSAMDAPEDEPGDPALGWIELPDGRWAGGRYHLLPSFQWTGPAGDALDVLNRVFTFDTHPGHGGERPGAAIITAAAQELGATGAQTGPDRDPAAAAGPDVVH